MAHWLQARLGSTPRLTPLRLSTTREVRGEPWVFVQNPHTGGVLRIRLDAWRALATLDGRVALRVWLDQADSPSQRAQWLNVLGTLDAQGLLDWGTAGPAAHSDVTTQQPGATPQRTFNPLGFRIPLLDPDRWLTAFVDRLPQPLTDSATWLAGVLMLLGILVGLSTVDPILTAWHQVLDSPTQWWYYLILFPLMKALHEAAHACALKRYGGHVHEAGVSFLFMVPLPYVDASDALLLPARRQRLLVSAAGMLAEMSMAAVALLVFLTVEPGAVRDVCFAVFVLGTASTLLFNANPLLRFDGYYILEDLLDMPGLARRAASWYRYRFRRHLLGVQSASPPPLTPREGVWLSSYGLASTLYRLFISLVIADWMIRQWHEAGLLVAALIAWQTLCRPAWRFVRYLLVDEELHAHRLRAGLRLTGAFAVVGAVLVFLPLPSSTRIEGMVWVPHQAELRVAETATLAEWLVDEGDWVAAGEPIARFDAPELETAHRQLVAEQQNARVALQVALTRDAAAVQGARETLRAIEARLSHVGQRLDALTLTAGATGRVVFDASVRAPGRLIQRGDVIAWLIDPDQLIVRTVVAQSRLGRLQSGIERVAVRLAEDPTQPLAARVQRQVPAANHELPSDALADDGFGGIAVSVDENDRLQTLERVFHVELELLTEVQPIGIGGRAFVTLAHAPESLGQRWLRQSHQLLLKHLMA